MMIKNYIAFTAINIIIALGIIAIANVAMAGYLREPTGDVNSQKKALKSGNYESVNAKKIVGSSGYFEILNSDNVLIFTSDHTRSVKSYTEEELECIGNYNSGITTETSEYKDENNQKRILITKTKYTENRGIRSSGVSYILLDSSYKVISASPALEKKEYTEKEYGYLSGTGRDGYYIEKYSFTGNDGKRYTLILNTVIAKEERYNSFTRYMYALLIFCYILCIIGFVLWLSRKVRKPLNVLHNAMDSLAEGRHWEEIHYTGTDEFVQICESFNKMAERLKNSEQENEEMAKQRQKMLADISHDLKTPITTIQGYAKALSDGIIPEGQQRKYYEKLYNKSIELTELINTFYEYSKLEHPDIVFAMESIEAAEFLREYLASRYEEIDDKGFYLEVSILEEKVWCNIDRTQMKRSFDNIISNSLKHNPPGTTISVTAEIKTITSQNQELCRNQATDYIELCFGDDGNGIPPEIAATVFEPFVVGDDSRNSKQGTGLGLSISKRIIEGHGGTMWLVPPEEKRYSTEFKILLPIE